MCTATKLMSNDEASSGLIVNSLNQSHVNGTGAQAPREQYNGPKLTTECELVFVDHSSWNRWSSWATMKQACDVHRQWGSKLMICLDNWTHLVQRHVHANIFFKLMNDCELFYLSHVHIKLMMSDEAHEQRYDGELIFLEPCARRRSSWTTMKQAHDCDFF